MRPVRTMLTAFLVGTAATVLAFPVPATARPATARPATAGTEPVSDYTQAIRERVFVETTVDSDHDGRRGRVEVRLIRPRETAEGHRVPVIFQPSPYYAGLNDVPNHDDVDRDGAARRAEAPSQADESILFAGYLDNYFVPRG